MEHILSMTVVQLREYAKEKNISIRGLRLKKDLQDAMLATLKTKSKTKSKTRSKRRSKTKSKTRSKRRSKTRSKRRSKSPLPKTTGKYKSDDYIVEEEEDDTEATKHAKSITRFLYKMYDTTNILKDDPLFEKCGIGRYIYRKWEPSVKKINIKTIVDALREILKKYKLKIPKDTSNSDVVLLFMSEYKDILDVTPEKYKTIISKLKKQK